MEKKTPIQFNRDQNGSLYDCGSADAYYNRKPKPHWRRQPEGTYLGLDTLASSIAEVEEYMSGYMECTDTKTFVNR